MTEQPLRRHPSLSIEQAASLACLLEAAAPKVGNVHRGADFEDMQLTDFLVSAVCIAPVMQRAARQGVGLTVLAAVQATRDRVPVNTNLGTILLLAPLASMPRDVELRSGLQEVLANLTPIDCREVYQAIRIAQPGGLGTAEAMDVHAADPPEDLIGAMQEAAERDLVARQYCNNFAEVLDVVLPALVDGCYRGWSLTDSIIRCHLQILARYSDSLIARKCGPELAAQASARAAETLSSGEPGDTQYHDSLRELDFWLRADGHNRNPGTAADLIAAGLFAGLRDGIIKPPYR